MIAVIKLVLMSWARGSEPSLRGWLSLVCQRRGRPLVRLGSFGARCIRCKRLLVLLLLVNLILGLLLGLDEVCENMCAVALSMTARFIFVPAELLPVLSEPLALPYESLVVGLALSFPHVFGGVGGGLCCMLLIVLVLGVLDRSCCVLAGKELRGVHRVSLRGRLPPSAPLMPGHRQLVRLLDSFVSSSGAWHNQRLVRAHLWRRGPGSFDHGRVCLGRAHQFHTLGLHADRIADVPFILLSRGALLARRRWLRERLLRLARRTS